MKKIRFTLSFTILLLLTFVFASCTDDGQTKYNVTFDSNGGTSVATQVVVKDGVATKPTDPTKRDYKFVEWFYIEDSKEVTFDFATKITKDYNLKAKWQAYEADIRIVGVNQNNSLVLFDSNRAVQDNKHTEFMDRTINYMVGDDNAWIVKPEVTFVEIDQDGTPTPTTVASWNYNIALYLKTTTGFTKLDEVNEYVETVDKKECKIDFSENAIGQSFKVEVYPEGLSETQIANISRYTKTFEFDVVDGYNVYNAKELAYMENRTGNDEGNAWNAFKQANNMPVELQPKNLILQKNISVSSEDVPGYFFYTAQELSINPNDPDASKVIGSMKDYKDIYQHIVEENGEFNLYGNYFTLNTEKLREVVREEANVPQKEGTVISHSTLIRIAGAETGTASYQNINFVGNAPRTELGIKSGGHILTKIQGPTFKVYNNISSCLFISYMPNYTAKPVLIEKCRAYDAFNCFIYNWGSPDVTIKDCEMIGAGGPVIIQDHVSPTAADGGSVGKTVVINSKLESYVTGSEGWFTTVGATAVVPIIKTLNDLFTPFGKSFLKNNEDGSLSYLNIISVNKSGEAEGLTAQKIKGSVKIDDYQAFDFGETNPYIKALLENTFSQGAPAFQTSAADLTSGYGYTDGKTGIFDLTNNKIVDPTNNMYQGDYLTLYYNGMAIVLGFYQSGQIYTAE